jgi:protein-tyrosine phosphatase
MSEILPGLLLGGLDLLYDLEFLREYKITHVLTIMDENILTTPMVTMKVTHMTVRLNDLDDEPIGDYFDRCVEFISSALAGGGAVFVHCLMGISRSPTIVAAYLMASRGMSADAALAFLSERRPIIDPNDGFRNALAAFGALKN